MVHVQPQSPSGVLHPVALSPPAAAASGFKCKGPHISIEIPGNSASRSNWRPALVIGFILFATAIAQVVLASGIRQKGIRVSVPFDGEGYNVAAGNPAIGLLALGVAACFIALSVLDKKNNRSHGGWVKGVKLMTTMYSSIALVVMVVWSFLERAVYLELSGYDHCVTGDGNEECICSSDQSDNAKVDIASDADISCESLLDHADDVLASYVLMVIMLALTVAGVWCKPHTSSTPKATAIVLEANPMPYVVSRTSPTTQWGRNHAH